MASKRPNAFDELWRLAPIVRVLLGANDPETWQGLQ
jgi:hypothetical protein